MPPSDLLCWQITRERQRHEWLRMRRSIVEARVRVVVYGHAVYFSACGALLAAGIGSSPVIAQGWWPLVLISVTLLLMEWTHMQSLPRIPPRFVVRASGITEYNEDGPREHWEWARMKKLEVATDSARPEYRSLVVSFSHSRISVPLPGRDASVNELQVVRALASALESSGICWQARPDGAIVLLHPKPLREPETTQSIPQFRFA